jgi:hypothetical protein
MKKKIKRKKGCLQTLGLDFVMRTEILAFLPHLHPLATEQNLLVQHCRHTGNLASPLNDLKI